MASWGRADFSELRKFAEKLEQACDPGKTDDFCRKMTKQMASRFLALVIRDTPVGVYSAASGKQGGTLRRGWVASTHEETYKHRAARPNVVSQRKAIEAAGIRTGGRQYSITLTNPVMYASYVEYGHRKVHNKGWADGKYFMTQTEREIERIMPGVLERELEAYWREVLHG